MPFYSEECRVFWREWIGLLSSLCLSEDKAQKETIDRKKIHRNTFWFHSFSERFLFPKVCDTCCDLKWSYSVFLSYTSSREEKGMSVVCGLTKAAGMLIYCLKCQSLSRIIPGLWITDLFVFTGELYFSARSSTVLTIWGWHKCSLKVRDLFPVDFRFLSMPGYCLDISHVMLI